MIFKSSSVFMRRGLLLTGILAASCGVLSAQAPQNDGPPPGGMQPGGMQSGGMHGRGGPERQLEMLTHVLALTADQQTQVKALLTEQRQKMEELRKSSSTGTDTATAGAPPNRAAMETIHNDTDTKINALLNDEQKTKFAALQAERKARMQQREGGGEAPPPPPGV
jgi:periplasmic protein CpxP/Spy